MANSEADWQQGGTRLESSALLLLFGGTFDPVHPGHIACAQAAGRELSAAAVHLLPSARPPHRQPVASAEQRAAMIELAVAEANARKQPDDPMLIADCRELLLAGQTETPSYTVTTLASVRRQHGAKRPVCLLLGADVLPELPHWHRPQQLPRLAHIAVLPRPGAVRPNRAMAAALRWQWSEHADALSAQPAGLAFVLRQTPELDVSSTRLRALPPGEDRDALLPPAVRRYLSDNDLYAGSALRQNA